MTSVTKKPATTTTMEMLLCIAVDGVTTTARAFKNTIIQLVRIGRVPFAGLNLSLASRKRESRDGHFVDNTLHK